jgi:hypothetical protein
MAWSAWASVKPSAALAWEKIRRIEVHPQVVALGPVDPTLEMGGLDLVAIDELAAVLQVTGVQVQPVSSRESG